MRPDGQPASPDETYSTGARHFHWWTALLIAIQLPLGIYMVNYGARTNFAPPTGQMYDGHKMIGLLILFFVLARLAYRILNGAPGDEPTLAPWQRVISHITHWAIYGLLLVVPLLGWLATSAYGPFQPFGIPMPALLSENPDLAKRLFAIHKASAMALVALVAMHVGAALFHYFIQKDGVLNRMWPGLPRRDR
jgi:cytochrome b561